MSDVAESAGVSRQLVSLVMRGTGYVSEEKKAHVLKAAEDLGYKRNRLAASLAGKKSNSIGLVVLDIHNQVFADFAEGVNEVLEPLGYQLLLAIENANSANSIESLVGLRVDGILIATHLKMNQETSRLLAGTPAITMGESAGGEEILSVHADDEVGGRLATEHLISEGHKKIFFVSGGNSKQNTLRSRGYANAMKAAGLESVVVDGDATEAGGRKAFELLRTNKNLPSAIFCYNDASAIGLLAAARESGLLVPQDLAIIGYDNTHASGYPGVDLSSVDPHAKEIGILAAKTLVSRIENPDFEAAPEILTPTLVVRKSSTAQIKTDGQ